MYIFLDESGTHKQSGNSSLVLVCVKSEFVDELESAIIEIEQNLKIYPFHWSESLWPVREKFISILSKNNFTLRVAIIKNPFRAKYVYESILNKLLDGLRFDSLVIDGRKGKLYERKLKKILRDKGVTVRNLKTVKNDSFPILRLADAIAGLVRYHIEFPEKEIAQRLFKKISKKIDALFQE
ncbi:MAG: DUF3800 domain-containing protein [Patescibacteria group bacterium]|nr:DUF3800 domain-containing protein [Patescibacteria group bacterium]